MTVEMLQLKEIYQHMLKQCDRLDESPSAFRDINRSVIPSRQRFEGNVQAYMGVLAAADHALSTFEVTFYEELFDDKFEQEAIRQYIIEGDLVDGSYQDSTPIFLVKFLELDHYTYNHKGALVESVAEEMILFYEILGNMVCACDGDVTESEIRKMTNYVQNMRAYRDKVYEGPHVALLNAKKRITQLCNTVVENNVQNKGKELLNETDKSNNKSTDQTEGEESLDDLLQQLEDLTGMTSVKEDVHTQINMQHVQELRQKRGLPVLPVSNHLVFMGNPGTGKTTVARLLSKIYHQMGVLSKGQLIEVDRSGLVVGYIGQTATKVQEVVQDAMGGVLFVDEAYTLAGKGDQDFGQEAIDTLLKAMEDHRDDLIVIVAGYPELMDEFVSSNPGLRSRFNKYINFEDYNPDEMVEIFQGMCEKGGYTVEEKVMAVVKLCFEKKYENRSDTFANGRDVRNIFEQLAQAQANRIATLSKVTDEQLMEIAMADVMTCITPH